MGKKKEDYYITLLKYARENMVVGEGEVDYPAVFEHVRSLHSQVSEQAFKRTFLQAVVTVIYQGREAHEDDIASGTPLVLSLDAYFHLLEHEELQEARRASLNALIMATLALVISAGLASASIAFQAGWL